MGSFAATPFGIGTLGTQPITQQPYLQLFSNPIGAYGVGGAQLLPQSLQLLQIVAQQLQQVQLLQQQQLVQLQQIQQLIQTVPQQLQYLQQQWQPFGAAMSNPFGFGATPHTFAGQGAGHVM